MTPRLRSRSLTLILAGCGLVVLATTAAAFTGSVDARVVQQGEDPRLEQLQAGWETYRFWCASCHAYSGEGLTPAWISTWAPDDQNCWQSKCHSLNHPDDGFLLPHYVPAIVGRGVLDHFRDGPTLFGYVSTFMPFQEPGVLSPEQYYAVLALVLNMNGIDYGVAPLGPATIGAVTLGSGAAASLPGAPDAQAPEVHSMPPAVGEDSAADNPRAGVWLVGLLASLGLAAIAAVAVASESGVSRE
jgi:hypothetical protein